MLESKRIYLRRFEEKDAEQLLKWGRNARYHNLAAFENYQNIEEAFDEKGEWVSDTLQKYNLEELVLNPTRNILNN